MLGIDQVEDYHNELVKLEDELYFEEREEMRREISERIDEIANILIQDKEDRRFYFNY